MTTATDTKITQQDEELAALGDLVAVIPCDADGLIRGVDSTDRLFVRGTLRQVDAQWDPYMALLTEINDNLIAIKNATGGTVVEPWKYVGEAGEIAFDDDWENDPSLVPTVFGPLRYRKEGDVVRVEGCVSGGTPDPTSATGVTTLPAGYRPEYITVVSGATSIDFDGDPLGTAVLTVTPLGTLAVAVATQSVVFYFATFVAA